MRASLCPALRQHEFYKFLHVLSILNVPKFRKERVLEGNDYNSTNLQVITEEHSNLITL